MEKSKSTKKTRLINPIVKEMLPFIFALMVYQLSITIAYNQSLYENVYATGINKWLVELISILTGMVRISVGELVLYAHVILVPILSILLLIKLFRGGFFKMLLKMAQYLCVLYILFMVLWGFNYSRQSVSNVLGFEVETYSKEVLYSMTQNLIEDANQLRNAQAEDDQGVMELVGGYKRVFSRARSGYDVIGQSVKSLNGYYARPKPILASEPMLYTGITGVYFPFTGEANVNIAIPDLLLPATTLHEMAHQRGIAPEDEANFLAFVVGRLHPDIDFQYSSTVLALIHAMNALHAQDPELAMALRATYSEAINRDLVAYGQFWKAYEGKTNEVADRVNDTYLKSNRQEDGIRSYGKMVDLLLGYYANGGF